MRMLSATAAVSFRLRRVRPRQSPRGGQSGSGASQRLVQCSEAMFWSGIKDVAVQLDVGDLVDGAVRGQDAVLVVAAEERDLDLLPLVLARVVLHRRRSV